MIHKFIFLVGLIVVILLLLHIVGSIVLYYLQKNGKKPKFRDIKLFENKKFSLKIYFFQNYRWQLGTSYDAGSPVSGDDTHLLCIDFVFMHIEIEMFKNK